MLNRIAALISVRSSSSRLPNKCFLPFGEGSVLEHVIKRSKYYGLNPIVCTTTESSDDAIVDLANKHNVRFYRGPVENKLLRWSQCCEYFDLDSFHSVDADDPFFDGVEVKSSMKMLEEEGLDMVYPTKSSSAGGASVGYSLTADIVKRACGDLSEDTDTEMMWYYMEKISNLKSRVLPEICKNAPKMRLTLDYEEDYWLLETLRKILGNLAERDEINQLFLANPDLHKINWFRNEEWKAVQLSKKL